MNDSFPIVTRKALNPIPAAKLWKKNVRSLRDLPADLPAYSSIVLHVGDEYLGYALNKIREDDPKFITAQYLTVVDLQAANIRIDFDIDSNSAVGKFRFWATFRCQVQNAERFVESRTGDLKSELRVYLSGIRKLWLCGNDRSLRDYDDVLARVEARLLAHTRKRGASLPGLLIEFVRVDVEVPQNVREFEQNWQNASQEAQASAHAATLKHEREILESKLRDAQRELELARKARNAHSQTQLEADLKHERDLVTAERDVAQSELAAARAALEEERSTLNSHKLDTLRQELEHERELARSKQQQLVADLSATRDALASEQAARRRSDQQVLDSDLAHAEELLELNRRREREILRARTDAAIAATVDQVARDDEDRKHAALLRSNDYAFVRAKLELIRDQELAEKKNSFKLAVAEQVRAVIERSRAALEAWGIENGSVTIEDVIARLDREDERARILDERKSATAVEKKDEETQILLSLVEIFARHHLLDRNIDPVAVVERLVGEVREARPASMVEAESPAGALSNGGDFGEAEAATSARNEHDTAEDGSSAADRDREVPSQADSSTVGANADHVVRPEALRTPES